MTPERFRLLSELYDLAEGLDGAARARLLDERCGNDEDLRNDLMAALDQEGGGLTGIVGDAAAAVIGQHDQWAGRRFGQYRIVRTIGEGGMGVVYEAEQDHPHRTVALKVVRSGLASAGLLRRFEWESEILARLQHPGIAQIYEAGAADAGFGPQPYFAMELIQGVPLTQYADAHQLGDRERLGLMAKVCDAVEHAHQRGVIHRDLKPANILVDESGQPKVLDFGVARATDSDAQATRQTDSGQLIGTLAYMSPEQVTADPLDLDTRSDVYALGVILFELLAHRLPYELSSNLTEAIRTIWEHDPARLSAVNRTYRGDIETIVSKALEKDKTRRYASAEALAGDIRRYLADQPISARPASAAYQLQKFARRHRALVVAIAVVLVVVVAGIIVTTREAIRARRAEQTQQAVNDFLRNDLLAQASAYTQLDRKSKPEPDLKVRTALDRAAQQIEGKFAQQPEIEAGIRETIGQTYSGLGLYKEAQVHLERSLQLRRRLLGGEHPNTLTATRVLGVNAIDQGNYPEAEKILSENLQVEQRVLGRDAQETRWSMLNLAVCYASAGKNHQAEEIDARLLSIDRKLLGNRHPETLKAMNNLAMVYGDEAKYREAQPLMRELLDARLQVLGRDHPETAMSYNNLGLVYKLQGDNENAERNYTEALEILRRVLGPDHPNVTMTMNNLVVVDIEQGKFDVAEALARRVLEMRRRLLGPEHPDTLQSLHNLGLVNYSQGKYAESETNYKQAVELRRRVLGPEHGRTLLSQRNLADLYIAQGRYDRAEALLKATLETARRVRGANHPDTLGVLLDLGDAYLTAGRYKEAEAAIREGFEAWKNRAGPEEPRTIGAATELASVYLLQRKFVEAEPLARSAVDFDRKQQPNDAVRFRAESLLGATLAGQKKFAEAEPLLLSAYTGLNERKATMAVPNRSQVDDARKWIIAMYQASGQSEKALGWSKAR